MVAINVNAFLNKFVNFQPYAGNGTLYDSRKIVFCIIPRLKKAKGLQTKRITQFVD